jgi:hypothetical protein
MSAKSSAPGEKAELHGGYDRRFQTSRLAHPGLGCRRQRHDEPGWPAPCPVVTQKAHRPGEEAWGDRQLDAVTVDPRVERLTPGRHDRRRQATDR